MASAVEFGHGPTESGDESPPDPVVAPEVADKPDVADITVSAPRPGRRGYHWALAPLLAAAVVLLAGLGVVATGTWSLFDEYTHFDYVSRFSSDFAFPPVNDGLSEFAVQVAVCEQAPGFGGLYPRCGSDIPLSDTPYGGLSTATGYVPWYYLVTGVIARAVAPTLRLLVPGRAETEYALFAARCVGVAYLGMLAALLVLLARRLGARDGPAAAVAVLACTNPIVLLQFATVNNDQFAVLFAAAAVLAWLAIPANRLVLRPVVAYGLAGLALLGKENSLVALLAVMLMQLLEPVRGPRWRHYLMPVALGGAVLAASQVIELAWPHVVGVRTTVNPMIDWIRAQGEPPFAAAASQSVAHFVQGLAAPIGPLAGPWFAAAATVLAAGAFGAALRISMTASPAPPTSQLWAVATTTWIYLLGFPILFLTILSLQGMPLFHQPRYLMPAMVLAIVLLAPGVTRRAGQVLVLVVAGYLAAVAAAIISAV